MTVTVTDRRTTRDEADATTNWSSPVAGESIALFTSNPDPVEATGHLGIAVSNETSDIVHDLAAATDLSDVLIYAWALPLGTMDTVANGGVMLVIGDGTNVIGYHVAGADLASFRHDSGQIAYQCLVVDTAALPASFTALAGSEASLDLTNVTQIGVAFKTLAKALGGTENCFVDVIRTDSGSQGLRVEGNTVTPGTFLDIAIEDRSNADAKAFGIIRELGANLFGCQGTLVIGDNVGATATTFRTTDEIVVWEDRNLGTTRYRFEAVGNATGVNEMTLGTKVGTNGGSNGCSLIIPPGVGGVFDAADANVDTLGLFDCLIQGFETSVTFANDTSWEVFATSFVGCGQIDPGTIQFQNNAIVNSVAASAMLLDADGTTNMSNLAFASAGTGHAIEITAPGTYNFVGFTFSGYAAIDGNTGNEAVFNNSGGAVTINVSGGGDTPTIRNGAGASTTVNNNISVTLTGLQDNTEVRVFEAGTTTVVDGIENATAGSPGNRSFTFTDSAGDFVDIRIINIEFEYLVLENFEIPTSDTSVPIQQRFDRNFENP